MWLEEKKEKQTRQSVLRRKDTYALPARRPLRPQSRWSFSSLQHAWEENSEEPKVLIKVFPMLVIECSILESLIGRDLVQSGRPLWRWFMSKGWKLMGQCMAQWRMALHGRLCSTRKLRSFSPAGVDWTHGRWGKVRVVLNGDRLLHVVLADVLVHLLNGQWLPVLSRHNSPSWSTVTTWAQVFSLSTSVIRNLL